MKYIGRDEFSRKLESILKNTKSNTKKLRIQSIEGPGGIGKTALLEHVIDTIDISHQKYLKLSIDGNNTNKKGLFSAIKQLTSEATSEIKLPKPAASYFSNVDSIISIHSQLHIELQAEAKKDKKINPENLEAGFNVLTNIGKAINAIAPKTADYVNFNELNKQKENTINFLRSCQTLAEENPSFLEKLGIGNTTALRNQIRNDAPHAISESLFTDLCAILYRPEAKNKLRPSQSKLDQVDRLLLIIDDYETTKDIFEDFLIDNFLIKLKDAPFESCVIIIGRDDIHNTHPGWAQHFGKNIEPAIKLNTLSQIEMNSLLDEFISIDISEKSRAWNDTQGYPLLVKL